MAFWPRVALPSWASFPRGTGGDFRRTLDLADDPGEASRRIRDTPARLVDAGRVSFVADDGSLAERHFVNVVSFGFSSDVARRANTSSKRLGGRVAFLAATVRSLVSYDNADVLVSIDDQPERRLSVLLAAVGNGAFLWRRHEDLPRGLARRRFARSGHCGKPGPRRVMANIHRIYSGMHLTMKEVQGTRVSRLKGRARGSRGEDPPGSRRGNPGPPSGQLRASARRAPRACVILRGV